MTAHDDPHADLEVVDLATGMDEDRRGPLVPRSERGRKARRPLVALLAVPVLLVVWVVIGAVSLLGVRADVQRTRADLLAARDLLAAGELEEAGEVFADSAEALGALESRVTGPTVWPIRALPQQRRTLDAVAALGDAGARAAEAAGDVAGAMQGEGGLGALTPRDGRIPLEPIAQLAPVLARAAEDVEEARRIAAAVPVDGVDAVVVDGRAQLLEVLLPAEDSLRTASEVAEVLPGLFGADGPRRYLVLASNPTENRGTGGFLGAYTVMEVADGRLSLGLVGDTQDLPVPPEGAVEWPDPSLAERWDDYGGARHFRSMNMTPDFPSAATTMERYWEVVMDAPLDGVIAVDPYAFESLLSISGPVEVGQFGEVGAEEVVEFVSYTAYSLVEDPIARKRLIGEVASASLQGFLSGPGDVSPAEVLEALAAMVHRDSLLIHAVRPEEQALLEDVGLDGGLPDVDGDLLAVILNSGSGSKVDYFLERVVRYDVTLREGGWADGIVSAGLRNTAPDRGELTYMIGPQSNDVPYSAGDNVSLVSVYCAPGCQLAEVPDVGYEGLATDRGEELGFPVASTWVLIPSMQARELIYSYATPGVWTEDAGGLVYRLHYVHQTSIRPTRLEVRVTVPEGHSPVGLPAGAEVVDGVVVVGMDVTADLDLEVRFSPA